MIGGFSWRMISSVLYGSRPEVDIGRFICHIDKMKCRLDG